MRRNELFSELYCKRGCFAVTIYSKTEPKMKKSNNPYFGNVRKLSTVNGMLNWHYGNSVNNRRSIEGHTEHFTPAPRQWGERLVRDDQTLTPFVLHNGKWYLELKVQNVINTAYEDLSGLPIEAQLIQPYFPERRPNKRQELEQEIILRDYAFDNVVGIEFDGKLVAIEN